MNQQQHYGSKFSGMNLGDEMKVVVIEEMSKEKPLDLTVKPLNFTQKKQAFNF